MTDITVQDELTDLEELLNLSEEFEQKHKEAFRLAFDYLRRWFPPRWDEEYWLGACNDMTKIVNENAENRAVPDLMLCVYDYLDHFLKEMKVRKTA